jgi:hypothetical protein
MIRRAILAAFTAAVFAIAVLLHPPGRAYACSCVVPPPVGQARDQAAAVFTGVVSAVVRQTESSQVEVRFNLTESWKGPIGPTLSLSTSASSASCGYEFVEGQRYLVYASEQDGALSTSLCSRTAPADGAADEIASLGIGRGVPRDVPDVILIDDRTIWVLVGIAIAMAGALIVVTVAVVRRIRRRRA